jgi:signal peptidase II
LFPKVWTKSVFSLAVAVLVILADQGSKILVAQRMSIGQSVSVLGDFFRLTFIRNAGGAFGIFLGGGWFYLAASVMAIVLIYFYFRRMPSGHAWSRISLAMILAGALGNLLDRLRFGAVTDFLDFGIGRLRWPIFNLADAAVTVGVAAFVLTILLKKVEDRGEDQETGRAQPE